jgi:hypothetical protein
MQTANATAEETQEKRKVGNPQWQKGTASPNPNGRPKGLNREKKTNRENRSAELLNLIRKFKPLQTKAIQAAVNILDNEEASENGKLRASAMIIQTYKELLKDLYDYRYDDEESEDIQQHNNVKFSLHMLPQPDKKEDDKE